MTNLSLDTNILFYSFDPRDRRKHSIATRIVAYLYQKDATIPLQCLSEFYNAATRKALAAAHVTETFVVDLIDNLRIEPANSQDVVSAIGLHRQTGFQYFDCLVLATAARIGVKTVFSEDMQHMRQIGSVTIVNPFLLAAAELDRFLS